MPFKKHTPVEIIGKLREAENVLAQGGTTADACRRLAISEQTYDRWRKEYGGLKTDLARRMKDLERVNVHLRRTISTSRLASDPVLINVSSENERFLARSKLI
jgi:putative transposase